MEIIKLTALVFIMAAINKALGFSDLSSMIGIAISSIVYVILT